MMTREQGKPGLLELKVCFSIMLYFMFTVAKKTKGIFNVTMDPTATSTSSVTTPQNHLFLLKTHVFGIGSVVN